MEPSAGAERERVAERVEATLAAVRRGAVDLIGADELRARAAERLAAGRGLRAKLGLDPSSPDLHVGHMVQLLKLRDLQELGHQVVLIVGDATAMVGDPSGRNVLRPQLTREEVRRNLETYTAQAALVLDMDRVELRHNSEWFDAFGFEDLLRLAGRMTVAQMLQRDTFQKRMREDQPVGIHEILYPLLQGWDSVMVAADVELGGTDQLFNLLVGRQIQEQVEKPRQAVVTSQLLEGLDGRKMSKSYGNAIGLTDAPREMYGRVMSLPDGAMELWFTTLTRLPDQEIAALLAGHPRDAKARLAREITAFLHGEPAADDAAAAFDRRFREHAVPDDVPEVAFEGEWPADGLPLMVLLREIGLAPSSSEARRAIQQGGVRVEGAVVPDPNARIPRPAQPLLVQVGKRRFARVRAG